jgi:hypothetical protein
MSIAQFLALPLGELAHPGSYRLLIRITMLLLDCVPEAVARQGIAM